MKIKYFKALSTFIATTAAMVLFQNCGNQFLIRQDLDQMNLSSCDNALEHVFAEKIHPFLRTNCSACHIDGGGGAGHFAVENKMIAFRDFMSIGIANIARNATSNTHRPPNTGSHHQATVNQLVADWSTAEQFAELCKQSQSQLDQQSSTAGFLTISRPLNNVLRTNWVTISWDLYNDALQAWQKSIIPAEFRIELRYLEQAGQIIGYEFRNPQLRLNSMQSIALRGLWISINSQRINDLTTYRQINTTITTNGAWINLMPQVGNAFIMRQTNPTDQISVKFEEIKMLDRPAGGTTPTTAITYNDLIGTDPTRNVFRSSCLNCHSNTLTRGGLNLQDPTQARNAATRILNRMQSATNPMPPGQQLPADRIQLVQRWISGGLQ